MSTARPSLPALAPRAILRSVVRWPVESQLHARRNAMVAATALAARRQELDEVEEFLAARARRRTVQEPRRRSG